jgi:coenzyme F420-0:L-glutamate ligase
MNPVRNHARAGAPKGPSGRAISNGMKVRAVKTRIFREGQELTAFIQKHIKELKDGSVLAVTSKVVALAEGRVVEAKGKRQKVKLIREESEWALQTHTEWWWTERDGALLVNAGIDESNADNRIILLPKDSYRTAEKTRKELMRAYKLKKLGVIITDSRISPMRAGVTGLALGYAGFRGVRDYRGKKDIFGKKLKVTMTDVADSLATAATLVMGEGNERQPLVIIEDAPVEFVDGFGKLTARKKEVQISAKDDMYAPLFKNVAGKRKRRTRRG